MEDFKAALEAKSDRFVVELYPANQLGTNADMIQGLQNGNVQGVVLPAGMFTSIAPVYELLAVPGLVPDADAQYRMLNESEVGDAVKAEVSKSGVTPLGFLWCPSNEFYLDKEAHALSDLKGMKARGLEAKVFQDSLTAYGMSPVVMSSGDVAMSLQNGTLNALYTDCTFVAPLKLFEKAKFVTRDLPGLPNSNALMFSNLFLDSLSEELRTLFEETVAEVRESTTEYTRNYTEECYEQITAGGGALLTPEQSFKDEIAEKSAEVRETFKKDHPEMVALYEQIEEWVAANS
jgi:C4-dicarboxylate-binding protein DctP